ncbi:MAG: hypothetical protein ABSC48_09530 [Terracidiphilus sp.]|jgi:hypothetical protein
MRLIVSVAGLATMLCLAVPCGFAKTPPASKDSSGTIVIVFKDGHRQSFNLSDIDRVEFPAAPTVAGEKSPGGPLLPSRAHFLGKWEVGNGSGGTFFITLEANGDAWRATAGSHEHGTWVYVDGEARITWEDGWTDVIRKVGSIYQKFAYKPGRSVTDTPDNFDSAKYATPRPI